MRFEDIQVGDTLIFRSREVKVTCLYPQDRRVECVTTQLPLVRWAAVRVNALRTADEQAARDERRKQRQLEVDRAVIRVQRAFCFPSPSARAYASGNKIVFYTRNPRLVRALLDAAGVEHECNDPADSIDAAVSAVENRFGVKASAERFGRLTGPIDQLVLRVYPEDLGPILVAVGAETDSTASELMDVIT